MIAVFWIAAALVIYAFAGYPVVLIALGLFARRDVKKLPIRPSVSLVIPAYNEERVIARKIANSIAIDYRKDRIEIVVVSDGSSDRTVELAQCSERVRMIALPENRGKVAALNEAIPQLRGDIVVFSDASAMLAPESLARLIENFADPSVGAVSGRYQTIRADDVNIGAAERFYWRYEAFLKTRESRLASTLGGHGHLHAIRRELYPFPSPETINDDYVIPLSVISRGFRAVHEPAAVVYEEAREMTGFARRIRIMAGNLQQLRCLAALLRPFRPVPLLFFLSHKVSRLLVPFAMLAALLANLSLLSSAPYRSLFLVQLCFYCVAVAGFTGRLRPRALRLPFYFCMVNSAAFFGVYHAITRGKNMAWK